MTPTSTALAPPTAATAPSTTVPAPPARMTAGATAATTPPPTTLHQAPTQAATITTGTAIMTMRKKRTKKRFERLVKLENYPFP